MMLVAKKYHVLIERDEDGVLVGRCPELRGCVSQGDTRDELLSNMREAILLCLDEKGSDTGFVGIDSIEV